MLLGVIIVSTTDLFHSAPTKLFVFSLVPLVVLVARARSRRRWCAAAATAALARARRRSRGALLQVRERASASSAIPRRGTAAAGRPARRLGGPAARLLGAVRGARARAQAGIGAAAAVLFAVNVTAVVPATPSNIGVFQLAVISVLTTGFGVGAADALAYGVILQAVEIATAVALGLPALVREGVTWSDMRLRALSAAPVRLQPRPRDARDTISG